MCKHNWANLVVKKGKKIVSIPKLKVCIKCGEMKLGKYSIRISKSRIDMDQKELRNLGLLQIPVGTDKYK